MSKFKIIHEDDDGDDIVLLDFHTDFKIIHEDDDGNEITLLDFHTDPKHKPWRNNFVPGFSILGKMPEPDFSRFDRQEIWQAALILFEAYEYQRDLPSCLEEAMEARRMLIEAS